jgi:uncharacterized protein (TIGR02246 family)
MMRKAALVILILIGVPTYGQPQQLPGSQVFIQNVEPDSVSLGLSCDGRQSWKPVTLKGHERQRYECESKTATIWAHASTDLPGELHQESELQLLSGSRYEVFFDQSARKWSLRLLGAAVSSGSSAVSPNRANDEAAIRAAHAAWNAASSNRDIQRILDLVTDDCVFLMADEPPFIGKEGVSKAFEQMSARYGDAKIEQYGEIQEIQIFGDTAFWRSTDTLTLMSAKGASTKVGGFGMGLLRRSHDGKWRFARWINTIMQN